MNRNGRALAESFVLHSLLAGLVLLLAGAIKPPPKTIRLDFSLLEKIVTPVQHVSPAPKARPMPKATSEPAPTPQPKTLPPVPSKTIKQIKPKLAALKLKPAVKPKITAAKAESAIAVPVVKSALIPEGPPQPTAPAVTSPVQALVQKRPVSAHQDTTPSTQSIDSTQLATKLQNYLSLVRIRIEKQKRYPLLARSRRLEGNVSIRFVLDPNGQVSKVGVSKSSGQDCLDKAAVDAIRQAAPLPPPPDGLLSSATSMELTIFFKLT